MLTVVMFNEPPAAYQGVRYPRPLSEPPSEPTSDPDDEDS